MESVWQPVIDQRWSKYNNGKVSPDIRKHETSLLTADVRKCLVFDRRRLRDIRGIRWEICIGSF